MSHRVVSRLLYLILKEKVDIILRRTVTYITENEVSKEEFQEEILGYTSLLHQTIGREEILSHLAEFNNIFNPDQKVDEEMNRGDFYGDENPELDDVVDQEDFKKPETDYDMFLGV